MDDLAAQKKDRHGHDQARRGQSFSGVLGQAPPDLAGTPVHPAVGQVRRVEEIGLKTGGAEGRGS